MYGLVHIGLRDLIVSSYGKDKWDEVLEASNLAEDAFVSMQSYPDEVTYQLVGGAVKVLDTSVEQLLMAFGRHWVLHTGPDVYGSILDMAGDSLPELVANLDDLHVRLSSIMPDLKAPSFQCEDVTEHHMTLHYRSSREGLTPMVIGLLEGIGERFHTPCTALVQSTTHEDGGVHVVLSVQWHDEQ